MSDYDPSSYYDAPPDGYKRKRREQYGSRPLFSMNIDPIEDEESEEESEEETDD